ncbi:MAG: hypothetical protein QGH31_11640 [Kiritimatiellia bacterium]|nr:hypothetical protein [Kiritimatiellia bacterium]
MQIPHIVTAGIDDLIPVVIIISVIIARIMKAAKQGKPMMPPPPGDRPQPTPQTPANQPAEELRDFLQALSGAAQTRSEPAPPPPPPPPPVPVPAQRPVAQKRFQAPPKPSRVRRRAKPVQAARQAPQPAPTTPQKPAPFWNQPPPAPRPVIVEACELNPARKELNKHLEDATSLRGAWLLREVLGPPVGLR